MAVKVKQGGSVFHNYSFNNAERPAGIKFRFQRPKKIS
jgi:hypothetical protein